MASLTVRLPRSTHDQLKTLARQEEVSINQLVLTAVAEKISALRASRFFAGLKEPIGREEFEAALAQVPDADPDPWDVWTQRRDL
jgi:hypothetical protein